MEEKGTENRKNGWYSFAKGLFAVLFRVFYPLRCSGDRNFMEAREPYILIANHNSSLDPLILIRLCPGEIRFLVKKELEKSRFLKWCMDKIHCIRVDRDDNDTHAFRSCLKALKEKNILGVFPEGTRHAGGRMENPRTGTALMALLQKVDILPVYINGRPRLFRRTEVIVGEPVCVSDFPEGRITAESIAHLSGLIKAKYEELRSRVSGART